MIKEKKQIAMLSQLVIEHHNKNIIALAEDEVK